MYSKDGKVIAVNCAGSSFGYIHESGHFHKFTDGENPHDMQDNLAVSQILVVVTDDDIEKGDVWLNLDNGEIRSDEGLAEVANSAPSCKKIVAGSVSAFDIQITDEFVDLFIARHNAGNPIFNVAIKMVDRCDRSGVFNYCMDCPGMKTSGCGMTEIIDVVDGYCTIREPIRIMLDITSKPSEDFLEKLKAEMQKIGPIQINSGYRSRSDQNTWDEIFEILKNPDVDMGTKEAMIRERYYSPMRKSDKKSHHNTH